MCLLSTWRNGPGQVQGKLIWGRELGRKEGGWGDPGLVVKGRHKGEASVAGGQQDSLPGMSEKGRSVFFSTCQVPLTPQGLELAQKLADSRGPELAEYGQRPE